MTVLVIFNISILLYMLTMQNDPENLQNASRYKPFCSGLYRIIVDGKTQGMHYQFLLFY